MTLAFDRVAQFQRQQGGPDAFGGASDKVWTDVFDPVWAAVEERVGSEALSGAVQIEKRLARVIVHKSADTDQLTAADAILIDGQRWQIESSAELRGAGLYVEFKCEAKMEPAT